MFTVPCHPILTTLHWCFPSYHQINIPLAHDTFFLHGVNRLRLFHLYHCFPLLLHLHYSFQTVGGHTRDSSEAFLDCLCLDTNEHGPCWTYRIPHYRLSYTQLRREITMVCVHFLFLDELPGHQAIPWILSTREAGISISLFQRKGWRLQDCLRRYCLPSWNTATRCLDACVTVVESCTALSMDFRALNAINIEMPSGQGRVLSSSSILT